MNLNESPTVWTSNLAVDKDGLPVIVIVEFWGKPNDAALVILKETMVDAICGRTLNADDIEMRRHVLKSSGVTANIGRSDMTGLTEDTPGLF